LRRDWWIFTFKSFWKLENILLR